MRKALKVERGVTWKGMEKWVWLEKTDEAYKREINLSKERILQYLWQSLQT
jgi:hypothetical protein